MNRSRLGPLQLGAVLKPRADQGVGARCSGPRHALEGSYLEAPYRRRHMSSTTLLNSDLLFLVLLHLAFVSPFFLLSPSHIVLPLTLLAHVRSHCPAGRPVVQAQAAAYPCKYLLALLLTVPLLVDGPIWPAMTRCRLSFEVGCHPTRTPPQCATQP